MGTEIFARPISQSLLPYANADHQENGTPNSEGSPKIAIHAPRISWIDSVKGIGIVLVVLGHVLPIGPVHFLIYVFHMPLFFLVSGYLHRVQPSLATFAKKKSVHLLVPYLSWVFITSALKIAYAARHGLSLTRIEHGLSVVFWGGSV